MKARKNFKHQDINEKKIEIGTFLHLCDKDIVIQLTCPNIPFPNSPVYVNNHQIGIIDEVLGSFEEVFASIKLEKVFDIKKYKKGDLFFGLESKFLKKERFLSRTETEVRKEKKDKFKKEKNFKRPDNGRFNQNKGRNSFAKNKGQGGFKKQRFNNKR